jgi:hypothetical protein
MARQFKRWSYNEAKTVLDQIGNRKFVSNHVLKDIGDGVGRTKGAVGALHYMWYVYLGVYKNGGNYLSKHLREVFDAYKSTSMDKYGTFNVNSNGKKPEMIIQESIVSAFTDSPTVTETEIKLKTLEQAFDILKQSVEEVIESAVKEGVRNKTNEIMNELTDLRSFKDNVKKTSVFMKLRQSLTGKAF